MMRHKTNDTFDQSGGIMELGYDVDISNRKVKVSLEASDEFWSVCAFRKQMLEHSRQQQSYLEHSSFTVEQQHKEVMDEIHKLYSESMASYQRAHEDRVHHRTSSALVREGDTALKDKTRQHQETQQLHRREAKDLDDLIVKNQQYIQMTEESRKKVKGLQVSSETEQVTVRWSVSEVFTR